MKTDGLMVGSLVSYKGTIKPLDAKDILIISMTDSNSYKPVLITTEYLVGMGFVRYDHVFEKFVGTTYLSITIIGAFIEVFLDDNKLPIRYVHQLQTLISGLTGVLPANNVIRYTDTYVGAGA
jgi:hypothetical protein